MAYGVFSRVTEHAIRNIEPVLHEFQKSQKFDILALVGCLSLALAFRLPGLTVFLTADEPRSWFGRSIIFLDALARGNWANTGPGGTVAYIENVSLSPAPGVTTMWTGALGLILEYWRQGMPGSLLEFLPTVPFDPLEPAMLFWLRLPGVLIAVAAVGLTYWWSRPLLGRRGAFLAAALLALDPFYLALSRVLGHDALVTTFMWLSLLAFLRALHTQQVSPTQPSTPAPPLPRSSAPLLPSPPAPRSPLPPPRSPLLALRSSLPALRSPLSWLILSGASAGFAFLSKYPALFTGAFIALAMLIVYLIQARSASAPRSTITALLAWVRDVAIWSIAAGLVFILFWPAMWVEPLRPLTVIFNDALRASGGSHDKGSFFLGQPVADPGSLFYPVVALLRLTPVTLLGALLALWVLIREIINRPTPDNSAIRNPQSAIRNPLPAPRSPQSTFRIPQSAILLAFILLYTLLVTYGGKKQDRYLLPIFPAVTILATIGYTYALRTTHSAFRIPHSAFRILPAALIIIQIILIFPTYPYYFSYYNTLFTGGQPPTDTIQVGWGEGLNEAAAYLNTLPGAESTDVVAWYSTTFEPYFKGKSIYKIEEEKISRNAKPGLAADYVVLYVNQVQRQLPTAGALQYFQAASPVYTVTLAGIDYAWIYPSVSMSHVIAGEARLVGQAELLGYELVDEAGRPVTTLYPESVSYLSLYWEWQGKVPDEPIQISLVDAAGQTRAWGNHIETAAPLPYEEWQDGMIVRDDFALVTFAETPPGEYQLSAWIDRPATGETVGVFPLPGETIEVIPSPAQAAGEQ